MPLVILRPVDAEALRAIDPLVPSKPFACWITLSEATDVVVDGKTIATLEPTDAGQRVSDVGPSLDLYTAIAASLGTDDTGEETDEWLSEGTAAMRTVLAQMPKSTLARWRGEHEVTLRMAENVARAYAMPAVAIEALMQRKFVARRGLLPTGCKAAELAEIAKDATKREERARLEFEAAERERLRPRTLEELEIEAVGVRHDRMGGAVAPWPMAVPLWTTESEVVFGFRCVEGLSLPPFHADGFRAIPREEIAPPGILTPPPPSTFAVGFAIDMRKRFAKDLDFGPIDPKRFTDAGFTRALEIIARLTQWLTVPAGDMLNSWRTAHAVQLVVRGTLVRPDLAASLVCAARDGVLAEMYAPHRVPMNPLQDIVLASERAKEPAKREFKMLDGSGTHSVETYLEEHAWQKNKHVEITHPLARGPASLATDPLAAMCVRAAEDGHVGAGELLETKEPPVTGKKASR
ncbi:MAG TPA: hypothetical protein VK841_18970 [Polyangiaceae bacterium]|nr:hypothetical protein [Polyangiaceae bacterium]